MSYAAIPSLSSVASIQVIRVSSRSMYLHCSSNCIGKTPVTLIWFCGRYAWMILLITSARSGIYLALVSSQLSETQGSLFGSVRDHGLTSGRIPYLSSRDINIWAHYHGECSGLRLAVIITCVLVPFHRPRPWRDVLAASETCCLSRGQLAIATGLCR